MNVSPYLVYIQKYLTWKRKNKTYKINIIRVNPWTRPPNYMQRLCIWFSETIVSLGTHSLCGLVHYCIYYPPTDLPSSRNVFGAGMSWISRSRQLRQSSSSFQCTQLGLDAMLLSWRFGDGSCLALNRRPQHAKYSPREMWAYELPVTCSESMRSWSSDHIVGPYHIFESDMHAEAKLLFLLATVVRCLNTVFPARQHSLSI